MKDGFVEAAAPLAAFLASLHVNDTFHREFVADLYDMVNGIRDEELSSIKSRLRTLKGLPGFSSNNLRLMAEVTRLNNRITYLVGA